MVPIGIGIIVVRVRSYVMALVCIYGCIFIMASQQSRIVRFSIFALYCSLFFYHLRHRETLQPRI